MMDHRVRSALRSSGGLQPRIEMAPYPSSMGMKREFDLVLFGGPALARAGAVLPLSPFQGALFGILGANGGRDLSRGSIAGLLWKPAPGAVVRRRVSQLLYTIKRKTGAEDLILVRGENLALDPDRVHTDLESYEDLLRQGELREAVELVSRGFFSGFTHPPTQVFDDWVEGKRLRLRAELRERAAAAWSTGSSTGRWRMAEAAAEVLLQLSPDDEESLRRVLQARAMSGRPEAAEALYHTFCERMPGDGGRWSPQEATTRLLERIRAMEGPPGQVAVAIATEREPALIGRDEELSRVSQAVGDVPAEGLRIIVVSGEAGVGKTRLVRDGLRPAPLEGLRVLRGQFAEFERDIPLNSLLEALTEPVVHEALRRLADPWRTVMLALLPEFHDGPDPLPEVPYIQPGELPRRLFEAIRQLFLELVVPAPVVLFLDDLQWADETTIAALEYLRRRWEGGRLTLILTLRPEGIVPASRIGRFVAELRSREGVERLDLAELAPDAAEALVREVAEQSLTVKEQKALASLGGHVPFFVIELAQEHVAGRLPPQPTDGRHIPIPLSIQQVLEQRLANLSPPADLVLKALCVYGHPAGVQELTRLAEIPAETCVLALEQLQSLRLVNWIPGGVMPRHQLIRHTVYAGAGEASRRWLHGKVAEHLHFQNPPPVDQLALHYHRAGMKEQALAFALEAAEKAEAAGGVAEALGYLGIARKSTTEPVRTTNIIGKLAHLHYLHRDFAEAGPLLSLAAEKFRSQGRIAEALMAETEKIDTLSQRESLPDRPLQELQRIKLEARQHGCWEVVAKALDVELHIRDRVGDIRGVAQTLAEAQLCLEEGNPAARCSALSCLAIDVFYGSAERALESARAAVLLAGEHNLTAELLKAQNRLILVLIHQGLVNSEEGRAIHAQALQAANQNGDLFSKFNLHSNLGVWLLDTGCYDQAAVAFEHAASVIKNSEARGARRTLFYNLAELHYHRNDIEAAVGLLEKARALLDPGTATSFLTTLHAGMGLCALYRGDLKGAREMEAALPEDPTFWFFEPATVATFRARLLERKGRVHAAVDYLEHVATSIAGRLVTNWIKVKIEQMRLVGKVDEVEAGRVASQVYRVSSELGLTERAQETQRFLR